MVALDDLVPLLVKMLEVLDKEGDTDAQVEEQDIGIVELEVDVVTHWVSPCPGLSKQACHFFGRALT